MQRLFTLFPLAFANAAQADTTATYANPGAACSMTVKIASNGDLRVEMKGNAPDTPPGRTYYFVGGEDYFVDPTDNGSVVMRVGDVAHVMAEQLAKVGFPSFAPRTMTLVRQGTISIRRWSGDAYYVQTADGRVSPRPVVVISHDPSLAELGKAMERQFATSEMMLSRVMKVHGPLSNVNQVLRSGAPISFAGAELQAVSFNLISREEFNLPSQPLPIAEVRKRMASTPVGESVRWPEGQSPAVPCHVMFEASGT